MSEYFENASYNDAIKALRWPLRWINRRKSKPREKGVLSVMLKKYNYNKFPLLENDSPILVSELSETIRFQQPWEYEERIYVIQEAYKIMQIKCFEN